MNRLTTAQKDYLRGLMRRLELPSDVITTLHQRAFVEAGIWDARAFGYRIGQRVDVVLDELDVGQASALIKAMKAQAE